jgi:hypothetical protein
VKFLFTYLAAHAVSWGIDPSTWAQIDLQTSAFEDAYKKAEDPNRGKADVKAKSDARKAQQKGARLYVKEYLINNHVISGEKPAHVHNPTHSVFNTRSPLTLKFDEEERGITFRYAARRENTRGEKSTWSEIFKAIIPYNSGQ